MIILSQCEPIRCRSFSINQQTWLFSMYLMKKLQFFPHGMLDQIPNLYWTKIDRSSNNNLLNKSTQKIMERENYEIGMGICNMAFYCCRSSLATASCKHRTWLQERSAVGLCKKEIYKVVSHVTLQARPRKLEEALIPFRAESNWSRI